MWISASGNRVATLDRKTAMVVASINFRPQAHKRAEVLSAVEELVDRLRGSDGCGRARLYADSEDANAYTIVSDWRSGAEANAFLDAPDFRRFRGLRFLPRNEPVIVIDDVRARVTRLCS